MRSSRHIAMDFLARREYSKRELQDKLIAKGIEADEARDVVEMLAEEGLQDEGRFAEAFLRSCQGRGLGPLRIRQEFEKRGVPEALMDETLQIDQSEWFSALKAVWHKKFSSLPTTPSAHAKQFRFLQSRGFVPEWISILLKNKEEPL
jgi:regulatory protein